MHQTPRRMIRYRSGAVALLVGATLLFPGGVLADSVKVMPAMEAPSPGKVVTQPLPPGSGAEGSQGLATLKVGREEAITTARRIFAIPETLGEPNVSINQSRDGATWGLQFQTPQKQAERIGISVDVDGVTGTILRYSKSVSGGDKAPLSYTRSEAMKLAAAWLDKLAAEYKESLRLVDNPLSHGFYGGGDAAYTFAWTRMEQGYPVQSDGVSIGIDARTGELRSFNVNWRRNVTFDLPKTILEEAGAEAAYRQQIPMQLVYKRFQKPGTEDAEWRLVYRPMTGYYPMLSQDGKVVDSSGDPLDLSAFQQMRHIPASTTSSRAPERPLTRDEALAMARQVSGRSDEPTGSHYNEHGQEQKERAWEFQWFKQGELNDGEFNTTVRIDAEQGTVLHVSNWGKDGGALKEGEEPKFSIGQAEEIAVAFIQAHRPDIAGNAMIMPGSRLHGMGKEMYRPSSHHFPILHLKHGIPVIERESNIEVDLRTGKVRYFNGFGGLPRTEEFPSPAGLTLTREGGLNTFLDHQGLEPAWVTFWAQPAPGGKEVSERQPELVWAPGQGVSITWIDAMTGAPLDYEGRDLIEAAKRPTDIEGHFAQREIELLWARRVLDLKDGKFRPDEPATAADLARWLVLVKGMRPYAAYDFYGQLGARGAAAGNLAMKVAVSEAAPYFGAAFQNGLILPEDFPDESSPSGPVNREIFALWAVRAMGYSSIAKMENRVAMPFADQTSIGPRFTNAVAILHGLGVISGGSESRFEPQRAITRGEAARILFGITAEGAFGPIYGGYYK